MKTLLSTICAAAALALCGNAALADTYPSKPIKIIAPFGPGGFTDVVARLLGVKLGEALGQAVVIENKPGAGSTIGTDYVAKAAPDGYTLVIVSSTHVISPWIYKSIPYDPIKSFAPVTKLVDSAYVLLVNPKLPVKNVQEFITLAKKDPETVHYASSGNGSAQHMIGGLFESMTGSPLKHVPYRSSSAATTDLISGVVESSFAGIPNALAQVPNGRLRALAVTSAKRAPQLPDVPTMQEAGVAGYDATIWLGMLAPAGTPKEIVNRLSSEITKIMATPETKKAMFDAGVEVSLSTPEALTQLMVSDMAKWGKVVKDTGIKIE